MPLSTKFRWRAPIVLLAFLAGAGTWAASQVRGMRDRTEVAKMTDQMKTDCAGRFLIDVPIHAQVSLSHEMISGVEMEAVEESETSFRERIAAREGDIAPRDASTDASRVGGMVEARDLRMPGMVGRTFIHGHSRGYLMEGDRRVDMASVSVESHGHMEGLSSSLSARYTDAGRAREAEAPLARLRPRGEDEIPSVPGFCRWRAVFVEPLPAHPTEYIALHIGLPDHPEVVLAFSSMPGSSGNADLLARVADTDASATADGLLRVTKLRIGRRDINGLAGEEVLERVREVNFTTGYHFFWAARGVERDPLRPYLLLDMETGTSPRPGGKPIDTTLHGDAVLALWDGIASSVRLRASSPAPAPGPQPLDAGTAPVRTKAVPNTHPDRSSAPPSSPGQPARLS